MSYGLYYVTLHVVMSNTCVHLQRSGGKFESRECGCRVQAWAPPPISTIRSGAGGPEGGRRGWRMTVSTVAIIIVTVMAVIVVVNIIVIVKSQSQS